MHTGGGNNHNKEVNGGGGEGGNYTQNPNYTQWIKNFVKVTKIFGTPFPAFLPEVFIYITLID